MRKSVRYLVAFATILANLTLNAQTDAKWDLRKCVEYALINNISVRQADIEARLSAVNLKEAKFQQIPSLSFSGNHGFSFGRVIDYTTNTYTNNSVMQQQLGLSSQVTIFNWRSLKNTIKSNNYTYKADLAAADKAKNDIALNVARQYLLVLLDIEQVEVTNIQLKQSKAQLNNTRKQVDAGALPELNAAELETQVAKDTAVLITSQTQVEVDKLVLKALINLPADASFDLDIPPVEKIPVDNILEISPSVVYEMATKTQPQVRVNNLRLLASKKNYESAKGKQYPIISAFGQLNSRYNAFLEGKNFGQLWSGYGRGLVDNFGPGIGIGLNIPIFNGWSARANIERAKLDIRNKELIIEQDTLKLKQDVYTAFNQAYGSYQTFNARQKEVATAERSFDLASKRYNIGSMQTIEWLTNQTTLYNARINMLISQYDYVFKMKVLEFYKGQGIKL